MCKKPQYFHTEFSGLDLHHTSSKLDERFERTHAFLAQLEGFVLLCWGNTIDCRSVPTATSSGYECVRIAEKTSLAKFTNTCAF